MFFFNIYLRPIMKKNVVRYRFIAILMPVLFIWYLVSISCFFHTHIIAGEKVNHSHPFSNEHQHSKSQADTISLLVNLSLLGDIHTHLHFGLPYYLLVLLPLVYSVSLLSNPYYLYRKFRAPPVSALLY